MRQNAASFEMVSSNALNIVFFEENLNMKSAYCCVSREACLLTSAIPKGE